MPNTPLTLTTAVGLTYALVSARLLHFAQGAWLCDVEIAADALITAPLPTGPVTLLLAGAGLKGTIDPNASGAWGPTGRVRVVAGAGGWSKSVLAQQFHSDGGVSSTLVYQGTGALVGETVIDEVPTIFPVDFVRAGSPSPASAVFRDAFWWVDVAGVTHVGPRIPAVPDPSLVIQDFDPVAGRVTFSCEGLLFPGTLLVDPRFGTTTPTVLDVEQVFDGTGSTGWGWVGSPSQPVSRLVGDLKNATLAWTRAAFLRAYRYRLVQYQGEGPGGPPERMALQAVSPAAGVPDLLPLSPWSGVAGIETELAPSQEVLVVFENADPTLPRVAVYSLVGKPLKITLDASVEIDVGVLAPLVNIAGGADFLVLFEPLNTFLTALQTWSAAVATSLNLAGFPIAGAQSALVSAIGTLQSAGPTKKTRAT